MTRADAHLDAMLRHLGAAYYESLHGRAARSDVARALDTVEEQLGEQGPPAPSPPGPSSRGTEEAPVGPAGQRRDDHHGGDRGPDHALPGYRPPADPAPDQRRARAEDGPRGGGCRLGDRPARRRGREAPAGPDGRLDRPPLAPAQAAVRAADRRRADDLPGHHHRPGRDHPGRGAADEHGAHLPAPGGRRGRQARRHREPPRPAQRLPAPGRRHRPRRPPGPGRAPARRRQGGHRGGQARGGDADRDDPARGRPRAGPDAAHGAADLGHRRRGRRREPARRGEGARTREGPREAALFALCPKVRD